jgi:hypothetical protein
MNSSIEFVEIVSEPSEIFFLISFSFIGVLILIGTIISLIFIISIILNKSLQSVASLLSCNSCALGLFYFIFHTFYVILAYYPLPTYRDNTTLCHIIGYMYSVTCCGISWSHAILASNRLCYSLFPRQRWLLTYTCAWYLIAIHWILTFGLPLPLIFFNAYQYQTEARICILTTRQTSTSLTGVILFYNIPFTSVIIVYILVWCHARRSSSAIISRTTRDLAIMRHILTLVIIDTVCGHPYITLVLLDYFGRAANEWYLIVTIFITLSVTANMCAIFIFNRKLRSLLWSKCICWHPSPSNTSVTTSAMIPMRPSSYGVNNGTTSSSLPSPIKLEFQPIEEEHY